MCACVCNSLSAAGAREARSHKPEAYMADGQRSVLVKSAAAVIWHA